MKTNLIIALAFGTVASFMFLATSACSSSAEMTGINEYSDVDGDADGDSDGDADNEKVVVEEDTDTETECDTENPVTLYLSADDSNSMAGPALARFLIENNIKVFGEIRTYEFLNYYNFDYEPDYNQITVTAQMRETGNDLGEYNLQIGVRAPNQSLDDRRRVNLTLSIDTSGSMDGTPIQRVKQSCIAIAGSLRLGDVISMVTWNTDQQVLLSSHAVLGPNDATLISHCNALDADGSTDLHSGLQAAYDLAEVNFSADKINRVLLVSDGGANVGVTDENLIAQKANDAEGEAIYLMGVGVGNPSNSGGYNDVLMDTVTDLGKGSYIFIDSAAEAANMFGERFLSNVELAARDVRVELTMPPTFGMVEFHGEEYSENPAEVEPQHLAPNDAMIYHQTVGSCDTSVLLENDLFSIEASYYDPETLEEKTASFEATLQELLDSNADQLVKGDAIVAYAEGLKTLQSLNGEAATDLIDDILSQVVQARSVLEEDEDLIEIEQLLQTYRSMF